MADDRINFVLCASAPKLIRSAPFSDLFTVCLQIRLNIFTALTFALPA